MMFTVTWKQSAEDELARIWNNAINRGAVTEAADRIDALLGSRPLEIGESRVSTIRVMFERPLGVYFDVSALDREVSVLRVWHFG